MRREYPVAAFFTITLAALGALPACAKSNASGVPTDAASDGPSNGEAPSPAAAIIGDAAAPSTSTRPSPGAAVWSHVDKLEDDSVLAKQLAVLLPHFGVDAGAKGGFDLQRIELVPPRQATLITMHDGSRPMILVTDEGKLLWAKEQPVAGILPPVEHLTITAHEALGVALFAWDSATKLVVGRVWADDSNAFGDFEMIHLEGCEDVVAGYVPDQGIYVFAATAAGPRMQLMNENNVLQKGRNGAAAGPAFRTAAPLSLVVASDGALFLGQYASATAKTSDLLDVVRYQKGKPTLAAPIEIEIPRVAAPIPRIALRRDGEGGTGVRLDLAHSAVASHAVAVAVDATGAVTRLEK
ncbi:hypothetical protein BH09MYX1_BH09MYX1_07640 [soil metagenome]